MPCTETLTHFAIKRVSAGIHNKKTIFNEEINFYPILSSSPHRKKKLFYKKTNYFMVTTIALPKNSYRQKVKNPKRRIQSRNFQ